MNMSIDHLATLYCHSSLRTYNVQAACPISFHVIYQFCFYCFLAVRNSTAFMPWLSMQPGVQIFPAGPHVQTVPKYPALATYQALYYIAKTNSLN